MQYSIYVLKMKPMDENGMGEGYDITKPWHPLYNIILFSLFGWLYMNGLAEPTITEALITGLIWAGICIFSYSPIFIRSYYIMGKFTSKVMKRIIRGYTEGMRGIVLLRIFRVAWLHEFSIRAKNPVHYNRFFF